MRRRAALLLRLVWRPCKLKWAKLWRVPRSCRTQLRPSSPETRAKSSRFATEPNLSIPQFAASVPKSTLCTMTGPWIPSSPTRQALRFLVSLCHCMFVCACNNWNFPIGSWMCMKWNWCWIRFGLGFFVWMCSWKKICIGPHVCWRMATPVHFFLLKLTVPFSLIVWLSAQV